MERMKYGGGKNMTNREGKVRDAGNTVKGSKIQGGGGRKLSRRDRLEIAQNAQKIWIHGFEIEVKNCTSCKRNKTDDLQRGIHEADS